MNDAARTNSLIHETSPYLLQHAHNPVDWHAWNDATLALARTENKPILLSIGYSACHWCHVMAHESFEDADTAALMNRLYVNIKVDREERPDLDRVYQLAHQVLTQRGGGWPLTVFLAPGDLTPFFAGTYFPREPRYGMPDFKQVLTRVAAFYRERPDDLHQQNAALRDVFRRIEKETATPASTLSDAPLQAAFRVLAQSFDPRFGGFGPAPKFPHSTGLEFLLRYAANPNRNAENAGQSRHMLDVSLSQMADGGIYDQLGGGFYRYSTDEQWIIPHFEKMLYDNGLLLALYAKAAAFTGNVRYAQVARETADWIMRKMQSPQGGYYSSLDADSEGQEGKYYVWDKQEIRALLNADEFAAFAPRYGLEQAPNFGERWHLHQVADQDTTSSSSNLERLLKSARQKLLAARQQRVRPSLDDKVLTAWNGLMISGMATAGRLLNEARFVESARRGMDFIRTNLWKDDGLLAAWREGKAKFPAYLDDYVFLLKGTLELVQANWNSELFDFATQIADQMIMRFEDRQHGGFWFTEDGSKTPLYRSKTFTDESLPAGNAAAALALLQLGHLHAEPRYLDAADRTLKAALPAIQSNPDAHAGMLPALQDALEPPPMTVLRGEPKQLIEWRRALDRRFNPRRIILAIPNTASHLSGLLAQCTARDDICAYACQGTQCSLPITELEKLVAA